MTGDQQPINISNQLTQRLDVDLVLQAAGLGVWELNPITNQVLWDQRCCQLFGINTQQLAYADTLLHIHPQDVERVNLALQWALNPQSDGHYQATYRTLGQDGRTRWIQSTGRRYLDPAGQPVRLAGVAQEVTEQVLNRMQLSETERQLHMMIEQAPVAIALFNGPDMIFQVCNEGMLHIIGKDKSVIGQPLAQAVPELEGQGFVERQQQVYQTGEPAFGRAVPAILASNGILQEAYYDFTYSPLRQATGEVWGVMVVATDVTQQVMARQKIEESEQFARTLFYNSPVAKLVYTGPEMILREANEKMLILFGRDASILGQPILAAIPELKRTQLGEQYRRVLATGEILEEMAEPIELIKGGQSYWGYYDYTYKPLIDLTGKVYGVIFTAIEVTQQVNAQQELARQKTYLQNALSIADLGTYTFDVASDTGRVSENVRRWFGSPSTHEPMADMLTRMHPDDLPQVQAVIEAALQSETQSGHDFEYRVVNPAEGGELYLRSFGKAQYQDGQAVSIIGVLQNVTEQVLARQRLEEAEVSLREAVELAQLGTWSIDVATGGLTFSDRLIGWFGYDPHGQAYQQVIPLLEAADQARVEQAVAWALKPASDGAYNEIYTVIHPTTGQKRILHARGKTVFDTAGNAVRLNGTAQDITLQREMQLALAQQVQQRTEELAAANEELAATNEELEAKNEAYEAMNAKLEEANRLLGRSNENLQTFAYVASHDLQEPLRKIQQFGNLLMTRYAGARGEELVYVERMQSAAARMSTLIKDLLDFARISTHQDVSEPVPLNEVVNQVLITLELTIAETEAQLSVSSLPTVAGDAFQLNQLFQNLLSNALKFRRPDRAPRIQLDSDRIGADQLPLGVKPTHSVPTYYQIKVMDNGIGFDEQYVDRIFQMFQRLHGKREYVGTGIGLAICERVVTNHGGAITATSQPGQGATFTIYLPA